VPNIKLQLVAPMLLHVLMARHAECMAVSMAVGMAESSPPSAALSSRMRWRPIGSSPIDAARLL
jgi:hypothetical protein